MSLSTAPPRIRVLLATYNGGRRLAEVLDAYSVLLPPSLPWGLWVVDNASSDDTPGILASHAGLLPITVVSESRPGKNCALNTGLLHMGMDFDLLVLTDDDAVPRSDFLVEWEKAVIDRPEFDLFGAEVIPRFASPVPPWLGKLRHEFGVIYAENSRADGEIEPGDIYGPNMAVRSAVFARGFRFNDLIGPNSLSADYPMGSETEFCERVARESGARAFFAVGPKVEHLVRPNQMTEDFVRGRAVRSGRGKAIRDKLVAEPIPYPGSLHFALRQAYRSLKAALGDRQAWWDRTWSEAYHNEARDRREAK